MYRFKDNKKFGELLKYLEVSMNLKAINYKCFENAKAEVLLELAKSSKNLCTINQIETITMNEYDVIPSGSVESISNIRGIELLKYVRENISKCQYKYIVVANIGQKITLSRNPQYEIVYNKVRKDDTIHFQQSNSLTTNIYIRMNFSNEREFLKLRAQIDLMFYMINDYIYKNSAVINESYKMNKVFLDKKNFFLHIKCVFIKCDIRVIRDFINSLKHLNFDEVLFRSMIGNLLNNTSLPTERDLEIIVNEIQEEYFFNIGKLIDDEDLKKYNEFLNCMQFQEFQAFLSDALEHESFVFYGNEEFI